MAIENRGKDHQTRRVLMILYEFPPSNDVGSFRAVKFIRNLGSFGWYPVVLAPSNSVHYSYDRTSEDELRGQCTIFRAPMLFPFGSHLRMRSDRMKRLHSFLWRGWNRVAIPDGAICWIPIAILVARRIIREEKIDVVFASGGPFSTLILVSLLKWTGNRRTKVVVDYRDPWTLNPFTAKSGIRGRIEGALETFVLRRVDAAIHVSEELKEFQHEGFRRFVNPERLFTITNSFVDLEPTGDRIESRPENDFLIVHAGNFYGNRGPEKFVEAVSMAASRNAEFACHARVSFCGIFDQGKLDVLREKFDVKGLIHFKSRIPQSEITPILQSSSILLLINSYGPGHHVNIPAKFFDYLRVRRPILCLSEEGALSNAIRRTHTGTVVSPTNPEQIAQALLFLFEKYKASRDDFHPDEAEVGKYKACHTTRILAGVLDSLRAQGDEVAGFEHYRGGLRERE